MMRLTDPSSGPPWAEWHAEIRPALTDLLRRLGLAQWADAAAGLSLREYALRLVPFDAGDADAWPDYVRHRSEAIEFPADFLFEEMTVMTRAAAGVQVVQVRKSSGTLLSEFSFDHNTALNFRLVEFFTCPVTVALIDPLPATCEVLATVVIDGASFRAMATLAPEGYRERLWLTSFGAVGGTP